MCANEHTYMRTRSRHSHTCSSDSQHVFSWNTYTCLIRTHMCVHVNTNMCTRATRICAHREHRYVYRWNKHICTREHTHLCAPGTRAHTHMRVPLITNMCSWNTHMRTAGTHICLESTFLLTCNTHLCSPGTHTCAHLEQALCSRNTSAGLDTQIKFPKPSVRRYSMGLCLEQRLCFVYVFQVGK